MGIMDFIKGNDSSAQESAIVKTEDITPEMSAQESTGPTTRVYTFISVYDFDAKLGIAGTNDLVQELLDAESYDLKTKHQTDLEEKDQALGIQQKRIAELEGTINLLKLGEESHAAEVNQLKATIEKQLQEILQANADRESAQQAHHELLAVHTRLQGDTNVLQTEKQQLQIQVEHLKQNSSPAVNSLEISSSAKLQEKASKVDEQVAANKKVNWGAQAEIAMRRFQQDNGPLDNLSQDKPKDTVTESQLRSSFRSDDPSASVASEDTGSTGVQTAATTVDPTAKDLPSMEQFEQLLTEVTDLRTWKADLESWRNSETNWRVDLEKKLEGHGIVIRSQAG